MIFSDLGIRHQFFSLNKEFFARKSNKNKLNPKIESWSQKIHFLGKGIDHLRLFLKILFNSL